VANWIKNTRPDLIADKLEKVVSRTGAGQVTFHGFEHTYNTPVLVSMLELPKELSEPDKYNLISQATFHAAGGGRITKDNLLKAINELIANFLQQPLKAYVLASSLSIPLHTLLKPVKWDSATITFSKFLPRRFQKAVSEIEKNAIGTVDGSSAHLMMKVRAHVKAHSPNKAVSLAMDALDSVRAIWNWGFNGGQWIRSSVGPHQPVNRILPGPLHTLHIPSGKQASSGWWYEENYIRPKVVHNLGQDLDHLYDLLKSTKRALTKSNYPEDLKHALLQYGRALDEYDWTNSFLQLWRTLELLTATRQAAYDKTVRRTAFLFSDYEYHIAVLSHLRSLRNFTVHRGGTRQDMEACMYQLKNYVEKLLSFHLF
jgi:hypothetical protein